MNFSHHNLDRTTQAGYLVDGTPILHKAGNKKSECQPNYLGITDIQPYITYAVETSDFSPGRSRVLQLEYVRNLQSDDRAF